MKPVLQLWCLMLYVKHVGTTMTCYSIQTIQYQDMVAHGISLYPQKTLESQANNMTFNQEAAL